MSPYPFSSRKKTSITGDLSRRRIRHTPSEVIVCLSPGKISMVEWHLTIGHLQSRKLAVKLIQRLPSHEFLPLRLTKPGILFVSNSSSRCKIPILLRNPIMIFGTPSKKDCIQNFRSFRSYLSMSLSFSIIADVLSSTQLIGSSLSSGLQSQTVKHHEHVERAIRIR